MPTLKTERPLEAGVSSRLERIWKKAYAASSLEDLSALYDEWAETYDEDHQVIGFFGHRSAARALAKYTPFKEVAKVLDLINGLRDKGIAVILISHRLDDIFYVCDRVMALYHGRNFAEGALGEIERNEVVGWIMGNRSGAGVEDAVDALHGADDVAQVAGIAHLEGEEQLGHPVA